MCFSLDIRVLQDCREQGGIFFEPGSPVINFAAKDQKTRPSQKHPPLPGINFHLFHHYGFLFHTGKMDMELISQQLADEARGEDIIRERHRTDQSLRQTFQQNFNRELTPQERQLLNSLPPYSQTEIEADAIVLKFKCPILQAIPELDDIVKFHGHYYSLKALKDL